MIISFGSYITCMTSSLSFHLTAVSRAQCILLCDSEESFFGPDGISLRGVLWRPEALHCRVLIPPEAWNCLARDPLSLGGEPRSSCIREPTLSDRAIGATRLETSILSQDHPPFLGTNNKHTSIAMPP